MDQRSLAAEERAERRQRAKWEQDERDSFARTFWRLEQRAKRPAPPASS